MAIAFETADMILTHDQAEHKFPPCREEQSASVEIKKNFQFNCNVGITDAENLGFGGGGEL